jgi:hypothetical protein
MKSIIHVELHSYLNELYCIFFVNLIYAHKRILNDYLIQFLIKLLNKLFYKKVQIILLMNRLKVYFIKFHFLGIYSKYSWTDKVNR